VACPNNRRWSYDAAASILSAVFTVALTAQTEKDRQHDGLTLLVDPKGALLALLRFEYQYDDHGSWIRRAETAEYGTPVPGGSASVRVTFRVITYF
jgi:hypothetical protein